MSAVMLYHFMKHCLPNSLENSKTKRLAKDQVAQTRLGTRR